MRESEDDSEGDDGLVDTDKQVEEALQRAQGMITTDLHTNDIQEDKLISDFVSDGCSCSEWNGNQHLQHDYFKLVRGVDLSRSELDLLILGQLLACTNQSPGVVTESHNRTSAIIHNLLVSLCVLRPLGCSMVLGGQGSRIW